MQDCELLDPAYPTVLVVPMNGNPSLAMAALTVVLQPNSTNGCRKVSYLLPQNLTCVAKTRITDATACCVTPTELQQLRQLVVLVIGGLAALSHDIRGLLSLLGWQEHAQTLNSA